MPITNVHLKLHKRCCKMQNWTFATKKMTDRSALEWVMFAAQEFPKKFHWMLLDEMVYFQHLKKKLQAAAKAFASSAQEN